MKAVEALTVLHLFRGVDVLAELTNEEKAGIGKELLTLLPHANLFPNSDSTIAACKRVIVDRVAQLEATNGSTVTAPAKAGKAVGKDKPNVPVQRVKQDA